jgi:biopolymer transport protein ExbD
MYRNAIVLLLHQITRSLPRRVGVLTICCVAGAVSIALSQQQSAPFPSPASSPAPAPAPVPSPVPFPSDPDAVRADSVVVSIPTDDQFYFGKVRVAQADIPEMMKQALKDKPPDEQIAYIKAAVSVRYGTVVSVMDDMRGAGVDRIGLLANKKKHPDVKPGPDVKPKRPASNSSRSSDATLSASAPVILIDVRSKTRLKLNSRRTSLSRLSGRLQKLLAGRSDKTVFIRAPRKMSCGDVVKVIDIAKGVGAQPIGLQVDHLQ